MAFVQLGADNKVLKESIQSKLEAVKKEPCDAKLYDFDDVFYRLFVDPDDRSKLLIELTTPNWSEYFCARIGSSLMYKLSHTNNLRHP